MHSRSLSVSILTIVSLSSVFTIPSSSDSESNLAASSSSTATTTLRAADNTTVQNEMPSSDSPTQRNQTPPPRTNQLGINVDPTSYPDQDPFLGMNAGGLPGRGPISNTGNLGRDSAFSGSTPSRVYSSNRAMLGTSGNNVPVRDQGNFQSALSPSRDTVPDPRGGGSADFSEVRAGATGSEEELRASGYPGPGMILGNRTAARNTQDMGILNPELGQPNTPNQQPMNAPDPNQPVATGLRQALDPNLNQTQSDNGGAGELWGRSIVLDKSRVHLNARQDFSMMGSGSGVGQGFGGGGGFGVGAGFGGGGGFEEEPEAGIAGQPFRRRAVFFGRKQVARGNHKNPNDLDRPAGGDATMRSGNDGEALAGGVRAAEGSSGLAGANLRSTKSSRPGYEAVNGLDGASSRTINANNPSSSQAAPFNNIPSQDSQINMNKSADGQDRQSNNIPSQGPQVNDENNSMRQERQVNDDNDNSSMNQNSQVNSDGNNDNSMSQGRRVDDEGNQNDEGNDEGNNDDGNNREGDDNRVANRMASAPMNNFLPMQDNGGLPSQNGGGPPFQSGGGGLPLQNGGGPPQQRQAGNNKFMMFNPSASDDQNSSNLN